MKLDLRTIVKPHHIKAKVLAAMQGRNRVWLFELYAAIPEATPDAIRSKVSMMVESGDLDRIKPGMFRLPTTIDHHRAPLMITNEHRPVA